MFRPMLAGSTAAGRIGHRDLDLEVVAAARVGVVDRRCRWCRPTCAVEYDLHAGGVRGVVDRRRQRPGREALVVVRVTLPARAVDAVAVGVGRVVRVREDAELERVGRVLERCDALPRGSIRISTESASQCATHSGGRDRVGLEVVADVDEEVQVVAAAGHLGVGARRRRRRRRRCRSRCRPASSRAPLGPPTCGRCRAPRRRTRRGSRRRPASGSPGASGIVVFGTIASVSVSLPGPRVEFVVVIGRDVLRVCGVGGIGASRRCSVRR